MARVLGWAHGGVSIEGRRAYSDRPHIQKAWKEGWIKAENAQRERNGETTIQRFFTDDQRICSQKP